MLLKAYAPALAEAAASVSSEVRERATFGGNLALDRIGDTAAALLATGMMGSAPLGQMTPTCLCLYFALAYLRMPE